MERASPVASRPPEDRRLRPSRRTDLDDHRTKRSRDARIHRLRVVEPTTVDPGARGRPVVGQPDDAVRVDVDGGVVPGGGAPGEDDLARGVAAEGQAPVVQPVPVAGRQSADHPDLGRRRLGGRRGRRGTRPAGTACRAQVDLRAGPQAAVGERRPPRMRAPVDLEVGRTLEDERGQRASQVGDGGGRVVNDHLHVDLGVPRPQDDPHLEVLRGGGGDGLAAPRHHPRLIVEPGLQPP